MSIVQHFDPSVAARELADDVRLDLAKKFLYDAHAPEQDTAQAARVHQHREQLARLVEQLAGADVSGLVHIAECMVLAPPDDDLFDSVADEQDLNTLGEYRYLAYRYLGPNRFLHLPTGQIGDGKHSA